MKKINFLFSALLYAGISSAQTLYVPGGSSNIGNNTTNANVGIGYSGTAIKEKLTVNGNILLGNMLVGPIGGSNGTPMISFNSDFSYNLYNSAPSYMGQVFFDPGTGKFHYRNTASTTGVGSNLSLFNYPLVITKDGNTAIGNGASVQDPQAKLHVFETAIIGPLLTSTELTAFNNAVTGGAACTGGSSYRLKLFVNGTAAAKEFRCHLTQWCDYVFEPSYELKPLEEVESFIKANKHLPEVPSESEVKDKGMAVGEMMQVHMKKIEELTLYMIELKKENKALAAEVARLKK